MQVTTFTQPFDLFDEPLFDHLDETLLDALVQQVPLSGSDR